MWFCESSTDFDSTVWSVEGGEKIPQTAGVANSHRVLRLRLAVASLRSDDIFVKVDAGGNCS